MVKKKVAISKEQKEELKGFEEVVDLFLGDETELVQKRRNNVEDYEIFNYLEKEIKRLEKIDYFYRHQLPLINEKPLIDNILDNTLLSLDQVQDEFVHKVKDPDSHFLKNLNTIYRNLFS